MLKLSNIVRLRKVVFYQKNNLTLINVHKKINHKLPQIATNYTLLEFPQRFRKEKHLVNLPLAQNKEKTIWQRISLVLTAKNKRKEVSQTHRKKQILSHHASKISLNTYIHSNNRLNKGQKQKNNIPIPCLKSSP